MIEANRHKDSTGHLRLSPLSGSVALAQAAGDAELEVIPAAPAQLQQRRGHSLQGVRSGTGEAPHFSVPYVIEKVASTMAAPAP